MGSESSAVTLAHLLRREVGKLRAGDRLATSRALQVRYQVSPATVSRALKILAAEGLVIARPGSGTEVVQEARHAGVLVGVGNAFLPAEDFRSYLRICFGLARSEAELGEGARRLGGVLARGTR